MEVIPHARKYSQNLEDHAYCLHRTAARIYLESKAVRGVGTRARRDLGYAVSPAWLSLSRKKVYVSYVCGGGTSELECGLDEFNRELRPGFLHGR